MSNSNNSKNTRKSAKDTGSAYNIQLSRKFLPNTETGMTYQINKLIIDELDINQRRVDFQRYLELFGYKPENTILQIHISGFFNKRQASQKETEKRKEAFKRYGGTTFVIVGRTHDPSIADNLISPKKKDPYERSSGYLGYLWKSKDKFGRAPHEVLPLDFTPTHIPYPKEWKTVFATKGYMIALHVPSSLSRKKNEIMRLLYGVSKRNNLDVKKEWLFLNEIEESLNPEDEKQSRSKKEGDLNDTLKRRLVNGEITKEEYLELRKIVSS
jgi:hypothetical protein